MKQGSSDDPFAEEIEDEQREDSEREELSESDEANTPTTEGEGVSGDSEEPAQSTQSLPYIYARDSVKDGRQQRPIFLRKEVEDGIPELVTLLESSFGEDVYRTDVLEAAVIVAQQNPKLVEDVMRKWGYGLE